MCPAPKIEQSKMVTVIHVSKLTFLTFLALSKYFFLVKNMSFYDLDIKESISEEFFEFWLFSFVKIAMLFKIQAKALFNDFSQILTYLLLKCYQPKRKSHDWLAQEISELFLWYFAHGAHFKCSFCLPLSLYRGQQTFSHAHFNGRICSNTEKGITVELIKLLNSNVLCSTK